MEGCNVKAFVSLYVSCLVTSFGYLILRLNRCISFHSLSSLVPCSFLALAKPYFLQSKENDQIKVYNILLKKLSSFHILFQHHRWVRNFGDTHFLHFLQKLMPNTSLSFPSYRIGNPPQ